MTSESLDRLRVWYNESQADLRSATASYRLVKDALGTLLAEITRDECPFCGSPPPPHHPGCIVTPILALWDSIS